MPLLLQLQMLIQHFFFSWKSNFNFFRMTIFGAFMCLIALTYFLYQVTHYQRSGEFVILTATTSVLQPAM